MTIDKFDEEKKKLAPKSGFNLIGIDYFSGNGGELYLVKHFEFYQDALKAKKERNNQEEYFILYKDAGGELCSR